MKVTLIYTLRNLQYYSPILFENQCAFIKSCSYDSIKINYNRVVEHNLENLAKICAKTFLSLIISISSQEDAECLRGRVEIIEIPDVSCYNPTDPYSRRTILNTDWKTFLSLKTFQCFDIILLNDMEEGYDWSSIRKRIKDATNIGVETENKDCIYFSALGFSTFSICHEFNDVAFLNWSRAAPSDHKCNLKYRFSNIYRDYKRVLITGVTGQDGSLLTEYLLGRDSDLPIVVFGTIRSISMLKHNNVQDAVMHARFIPLILNLCDNLNTEIIFENIRPNYFYNCAAQTMVNISENRAIIDTMLVNTMAPLNHLELIKKYDKKCRYFSCGSSEEFGKTRYTPQDLDHPMNPTSIYGVSKLATHHIVKYYRDHEELFCCHGILYNHEGTRRNINFVTRKITTEVVKIKLAIESGMPLKPLLVGNIFSRRDWSDSEDFVEGFWMALNHDVPDDYILAAGESHSVKEFIDKTFEAAEIPIVWKIDSSNALNHRALYKDTVVVKVDKRFYRQNDVQRNFAGDNTLIRNQLGWEPKTSFDTLIKKMVTNDIELLSKTKFMS